MDEKSKIAREQLELALDIGVSMMQAGAEINRIEESVSRICKAFGATKVEVFAVRYLIVATVSGNGYSGITETRSAWKYERNLSKLTALNDLSRNICNGIIDYEQIREKFNDIENIKDWNLIQMMIIYALISSSFTIFFGGDAVDMLVSGFIGLLVAPVDRLLNLIQINSFVRVGCCSFVCGLLAAIAYKAGINISTDMIGIGNIMIFIPGVLFTIAIQEILCNNMLSGVSKIVESIILSLVIATGFAVVSVQLL